MTHLPEKCFYCPKPAAWYVKMGKTNLRACQTHLRRVIESLLSPGAAAPFFLERYEKK